ncbi:MAG: valine--tRNA ligase, partial [Daejeonella sp.]
IYLYKKGRIYRGIRMVNWDPKGKTAVSDEEVIRKEVNQKLYYIKYIVADVGENPSQYSILNTQYLTIATTRPETIMADTAICINPKDERFRHLKGKTVFVPLINREIPIIEDEYVDMEFGTGCLKVTPAHDLNDYSLGQKHNLKVIDILNDDGTLNQSAQILIGEDRFAARKKIAVLLEEAGHLEKVEDYKSQIGFSERTDAAIEPKLSMQWFCKMDEMAKPALDSVLNREVNLIPDKFTNTYRHWMENVKDWCISRQLWWGQRIPAWYNEKGDWVVAKTKEEAIEQFKIQSLEFNIESIRQDDDVLDTWFSSWLWPISVFDGFKDPDNADINYYYPTNDLVTAPEILFFWVARMIMAGHEFRDKEPFKNVYLTGIVRDKLGRKMSKSLGNSPDPIDLIEKYGADGVRVGMLLCSPAGNDLMFDESYCEQGRNFANKIWNASRLIKGWETTPYYSDYSSDLFAKHWFAARINEALIQIEDHFKHYRLSDALMTIYKLVWDDFCSWYLEMIKPAYQQPINGETYKVTINFFEHLLRIIHPFMPFISEDLYHDKEIFAERGELDCCIVANYPKSVSGLSSVLKEFEVVKQVISEIRNMRNVRQISPKEKLPLYIKANPSIDYYPYFNLIIKLANTDLPVLTKDKITGAVSFMVSIDEFFIPLTENVDTDAERKRLTKEIDYLHGFLKSVNAKLLNERFVQNAKADIIENERNKKADAEAKIKVLEESLNELRG